MKFRTIVSLLIISILTFELNAQNQSPKNPILLTADSLATGNYKDVLTSFFQLAFDNLTGPNKQLRFSSNPYALMVRADKELARDVNYKKYRALRNLNFNFDIKLDTSFKFNGFSSGIKYAIINKRDYTVFKEFSSLVVDKNKEFTSLNQGISAAFVRIPMTDSSLRRRLAKQWADLKDAQAKFTWDKVDKDVKEKILKVMEDSSLLGFKRLITENKKASFAQLLSDNYEAIKNSFKNRLLWTVAVADTTYSDQLMFSNLTLSTQVLRGITNPSSNHALEIDLRGQYNFTDDSLKVSRDLKRTAMSFEGGLNYVWRSGKTNLSFFEFKASASYNRIFSGLYASEKKELFTLNGTLRVRIFEDIWIPVQFRYDPDSGNVFGILNVKANFTSLKKIFPK